MSTLWDPRLFCVLLNSYEWHNPGNTLGLMLQVEFLGEPLMAHFFREESVEVSITYCNRQHHCIVDELSDDVLQVEFGLTSAQVASLKELLVEAAYAHGEDFGYLETFQQAFADRHRRV